MNRTDVCFDGCLNMYGAHIKLCVKDYADVHNYIKEMELFVKKRRKVGTFASGKKSRYSQLLHNYYSAKRFLFDGGLEEAIERFGLPLDAEYVKREAREYAQKGGYREGGRIIDSLEERAEA